MSAPEEVLFTVCEFHVHLARREVAKRLTELRACGAELEVVHDVQGMACIARIANAEGGARNITIDPIGLTQRALSALSAARS